jgi:predicted RNA-binding Zn-ribbon protein involved in translation (DUF1610 family)
MAEHSSSGSSTQSPVQLTEKDVQFDCPHCANILVVDRDGEGLQLSCPFCGGPVIVPAESDPQYRKGYTPPAETHETPAAQKEPEASEKPAPASPPKPPEPEKPAYTFDFAGVPLDELEKRLEELKRHLKENQSQRVEMQGYINKATLDLHRFQLKQKTLVERQHKFESEFKAIQAQLAALSAKQGEKP